MTDPATRLKEAVSSLRIVGTVFLVLGCLPGVAVWHDGLRNSLHALPFLFTAALLWVGPGVLYHVTAVLIRKHDVRVALLSRRTAFGQSILAVLAIVVAYVTGQFDRRHAWSPALVPGVVTIFFVPALLVQVHQIGVALEALRHLSMPGHGFQVQPMPVVPATDDDGADAHGSPG